MFDHVGLSVRDYAASRAFYEHALTPLGYTVVMGGDDWKGAGFGDRGKPEFWIVQRDPVGTGTHVAFHCADRASVDAFHAAALAAGGTDNGAPGVREADVRPRRSQRPRLRGEPRVLRAGARAARLPGRDGRATSGRAPASAPGQAGVLDRPARPGRHRHARRVPLRRPRDGRRVPRRRARRGRHRQRRPRRPRAVPPDLLRRVRARPRRQQRRGRLPPRAWTKPRASRQRARPSGVGMAASKPSVRSTTVSAERRPQDLDEQHFARDRRRDALHRGSPHPRRACGRGAAARRRGRAPRSRRSRRRRTSSATSPAGSARAPSSRSRRNS